MTIPKAQPAPETQPAPKASKGKRTPAPPPGPRGGRDLFAPLRRKRPDEETPLLTGPLAHQRAPSLPLHTPSAAAAKPEVARVDAVADRILTGVTARGEATARIDLNLNLGDFAGAQIDLVAGTRGIEVNVLAATAAARRVIQAKLSDLADALAQRGVYARKIAVSVRQGDNRGGSRQDARR